MRKHIFNAGPAVLPVPVLEKVSKSVQDLDGIGMSILEISHRSKEFEAIINDAINLMKEIMQIPEGYHIIFVGGGASTQFGMVAMNFLNKKAAYLETGNWAKKAIKEAKLFGEVQIVATSADKNFTYLPKNFIIPTDVDYFHITTNNTIYGTELKTDLNSPVPLVADMSSDICSRPIDISKYSLIYAGAQKNIGPAGVTIAIIKDEFLNHQVTDRIIPTMLNYKTHTENNSLYNTPPVYAIYVVKEVMNWLKNEIGGLENMKKINEEKAKILNDYLDNSKMFVPTVPDKEDRSLMNITFVMQEPYKELEATFIDYAKTHGIVGIKGHRSVGGFRASMYNALPVDSVKALVQAMEDFEKTNLK
ncbi:MAG: 3-phosphoserine/phosphohydroxythreonine transaminase [Bacteroidales bacterium]|jgi:phosphoserine aminotransferase|nr:3-phosphoserine/phosphohydroxythreonine transaminase [Bacteroidales bacterium]MDI9575794.1 3-phosphoserine/phosphohydroxythreonine transaminase [Bacteroidota bacterium]MDD3755579.1 3-phosphoserine/phosphohydroxythreonine transaminase [Bacteroidales bacterium]MDY0400754.1 3-phosphoserine/phosphohydroxythreonine transaminase [Bacteroidales bacterium]HHW59113.1 3-phosphoserine/phosphohydroxythreonine transaminase [Bacteroidales bacterium]